MSEDDGTPKRRPQSHPSGRLFRICVVTLQPRRRIQRRRAASVAVVAVVAVVTVVAFALSSVTHAFLLVLLPRQHRQPSFFSTNLRRCHLTAHSHRTTTTTATTTTTSLLSDLERLTVKQLRQMVKDDPTAPRGIFSRLKRKQDFVEYLTEAASGNREGDGERDTNLEMAERTPRLELQPSGAAVPLLDDATGGGGGERETAARIPPGPTRIRNLPPLDNRHSNAVVQQSQQSRPRSPLSPKDLILEQVYERYPLLLRPDPPLAAADGTDSTTASATASATGVVADVRQQYHPMLMHNQSSCDMDVVFVGTASCTPGTTRGVSCTALRLNWKRRASTTSAAASQASQSATFSSSSSQPTIPNTSSFQGGTWLFDVGECTQLQVQRTSSVRPSKITKIFLTHAHGDHSFGLPGLLCLMGQDRERSSGAALNDATSSSTSSSPPPPVDIYGPEGLRMWLRVAIRYSVSRIVPPYRVHELHGVPMAPEWDFNPRTRRYYFKGGRPSSPPPPPTGSSSDATQQQQHHHPQQYSRTRRPWGEHGLAGEDPTNWISQASRMPLQASSLYGEVDGGRDIRPVYGHPRSADGAPVWEVEDEDDVRVYAAPMSHGIPCVGYVVEELPAPGRLRNEIVLPIVQRNIPALKQAGFKVPMKAMAVIKNLAPGSAFTFPDGTVITQEEAVEPPRPGRKVVICGDTADCRSLHVLAQDADLVVHEATNTYLAGVDKDTDLRATTRDAMVHGHSTPYMAGEFARTVHAKRLVLNHFSARYKGDASPDSLSIMMRIERQAIKASGLDETQVAAAWDLMVLPVPRDIPKPS